ncbi:MAG: DUF835 domain-containing protein [Thermoplasmata archaeon]
MIIYFEIENVSPSLHLARIIIMDNDNDIIFKPRNGWKDDQKLRDGGSQILQYISAFVALTMSAVIVIALLRQRTMKAFHKTILIISILFLVCAISAHLFIYTAVAQTDFSSFVTVSKKIQATFDLLMGIMAGAFAVVIANPEMMGARDLGRYLRREFPSAYIFYLIIMTGAIISTIIAPVEVVYEGGSTFTFTFPLWFIAMLAIASIATVLFIPCKLISYLMRTKLPKSVVFNTYLILIGMVSYTLSELFFEVVLPSQSIDLRGIGFVFGILMLGLVAYAVRGPSYLQELVVPVSEANLGTQRRFELHDGQSYLIVDTSPNLSFEVFRDLVTHGYQGLCITRLPPRRVRSEFSLEKTPVLWLSRVSGDKDTIRPWPLEGISRAVEHFVSTGEKTVVLLDGLEYIISHNDFQSSLTLLHDLNERMAMKDSILILPLDPEALEEKEFALIRRDLVELEPSAVRNIMREVIMEEDFTKGLTKEKAET